MYLWYFHQKYILLSKTTHISGNHINLEIKTISYKYGKGLDCKNCNETHAYNE